MLIIEQAKQEQLLNKLIKLHYYEVQEFAIAPNDKEIMIVLGNTDMPHEEYAYEERNRSIWKCEIESGDVTQLTRPEEDAFAPSWSPDGERVAYFSRASGKKELWIMNQDGTDKRQLTFSNFEGKDPFHESQIKWAFDGSMIAYTVKPNDSFYGLWQTLIKESNESKKIQVENGENKQKALYQQARSLFKSSLFILNPQTGETKQIIVDSKRPINIIDWCANTHKLLIRHGSALFKVDPFLIELLLDGNSGMIHVMDTTLLSARLTNGHLEIGHIRDHAFLKKHEVKMVGEEPITLQAWSNDGQYVYFTSQAGLSNILYSVRVQDGKVSKVTEREKTVEDIPQCPAKVQSYHQKEGILFPYSGPQEPWELWEANYHGEIKKVSRLCAELLPESLPRVEVVQYHSEGFEIESLLVLPKGAEPNKKHPTLIYLHGGPEDYVRANVTELISGRAQSAAFLLAEEGYAVFMPNFRGSAGYGEKFECELSNYKIMQAPFEDIMAGVDYLINAGIADPEQLGIYGSSFGAILTAWAVSQTACFKGAVGAVGIYDQLQIDRYLNHSFHSISENRSQSTIENDFWVKPEAYKEISPMEHFDKIKTPFLFIETAAEREYNGSSAKPLFNALITQNIPSYLVYYPEAYHNGGWNDEYKRDYIMRLIAWFDHCLLGKELPDWFE